MQAVEQDLRVAADQAARAARLQFDLMDTGYLSSGGWMQADEMVERLRRQGVVEPRQALARWLGNGQLLGVAWQERTLLPRFQFVEGGISLRPELAPILRELAESLHGWEIALWFAHPCLWLDEALPADELLKDADRVLEAARIERLMCRK